MNVTTRTAPNLFWMIPLALTGFVLMALIAVNPLAGTVAIAIVALVGLSLKWPELATLAVIFLVYINAPAVAATFHKVPKPVAALVGLLLILPLVDRLVVRREKIIIDRTFLLALLYLAVMVASTIFAKDLKVATRIIRDLIFYGLIFYFLISNLVRNLPELKRIIAVLLLAGGLMGGLTVYQKATNTLDNNYGGFAQIGGVFGVGKSWGKIALELRSNGPVGEKNFYGQVLIVLVPLAAIALARSKSRLRRAGAALAGGLILGGIVLTFSRAALLATFILIFLLIAMRYFKLYQVALVAAIALVSFAGTSQNFFKRVQSMAQAPAFLVGKSEQMQLADESMRRRYAQSMAALEVFADHPLLGVGPGQFAPFYSTPYVNRGGLAPQAKGYYAHNLYLEIAAETGVLGLLVFLAIVGIPFVQLWKRWWRLRSSQPDLAALSAAFFLSLTSYLFIGIFLHMAYQRYFWLLMALIAAAVRIVDQEEANRNAMSEEVLPEEVESTTN